MLQERDQEILRRAFECWPERLTPYGHPEEEPAFTERMETRGEEIRAQFGVVPLDVAVLRSFLVDVGYWKMPRNRQDHAANVEKNTDANVLEVFSGLEEAVDDRERISLCTQLVGFGRGTSQTRMASTILRFLWPQEYGVIDWRNWAVLSNCGHVFLSQPLLPPLAATTAALKGALYSVDTYLAYLGVVRGLMLVLDLPRAADVDLAIYSYSAEIWPFPRYDAIPALRESLPARLADRQRAIKSKSLPLKEIYETYWDEWQRLNDLPLEKQRSEKLDFLWMCVDMTPPGIMVWDDVTQMRLPYEVKHARDLGDVSAKVNSMSAKRAVDELNAFMWSMRLKGYNLGVLP